MPVLDDDTVETLSARILVEEHRLYPEAIRLVLEGAGVWRPPFRPVRVQPVDAGWSVSTATSGGQLIRTGTYTVPTPRLTNIVVSLAAARRRPRPETSGGHGADDRQHDLPAVGVAGEHERHVEAAASVSRRGSCASSTIGARRAAQHRGDVGRRAWSRSGCRRVRASRRDRQSRPRVLQHLDAACGERRRHVVVVVVVAEDAEHAVRRRQGAERSADGPTYCRSPQVT